MPTGQPEADPKSLPPFQSTAERIICEAMETGDFDDLPGTGKPIPGAGTVDDEMWWVRSWLERNRESYVQDSTKPE